MDQANNAYCAFNQDGSSRGPSHSTLSFRAAWRRVVLALRGGQGELAGGPFRLSRYPNARRELRRRIAAPRFLAFAPEWLGR
jgi:hypothetical protein